MIIKSKHREYKVSFVKDYLSALNFKQRAYVIISRRLCTSTIKRKFQNIILIDTCEEKKTLSYCQKIITELLKKGIRKNDVLIAIGGGITGDLVGFISSILFRGVDWIFCPTTVLSMADSCVGSKTSINFCGYKNILGTFWPPVEVIIDESFLNTLPEDAIKSGIGEILHFYLVGGRLDLAETLMKDYDVYLRYPKKLIPFIKASLEIKQKFVEKDEFDKNIRNLLGFGHTFGHALESATNYKVNHGQAVTWGMDKEFSISKDMGYLSQDKFLQLHRVLEKNLPLGINISEKFYKAVGFDKKRKGDGIYCILSKGEGEMFMTNLKELQ